MKVILRVEQGLDHKRNFVITRNTLLGRSTCCDLRIDSNDISRRHCFLLVTAEGVWIRDLSSANGTIVNGRRLDDGEECLLHPGATLSLGPVDFSVHFELSGQPALAQVGPASPSSMSNADLLDHGDAQFLDSDQVSSESNRLQQHLEESYIPPNRGGSSYRIDHPGESADSEGSRLITFFSHLVGWKKSDNK